MKDMAQLTLKWGVNHKMTTAIKGSQEGLNQIEVPLFEWYYSDKTKEIYQYNEGVYEAYTPYTPQQGLLPTHPSNFYSHHQLKVIPNDVV